MTFWTYMLHCRSGYFYVGHTDDLERRMAAHASGAVPGFVHEHWPAELVWSEEFSGRYEALAAERRIKGWSRAKKLALIRGDWDEISRLSKGKSSPSTSSGRTVMGSERPSVSKRPLFSVRPELVEGLSLLPHPLSSIRHPARVAAKLRYDEGRLELTYFLLGDLADLVIPPPAEAGFADELWQTSCFELFARKPGHSNYLEFNLSPSGQWASYAFTAYRQDMQPRRERDPQIAFRREGDGAVLDAVLALPEPGPWLIGLSAILEHEGGSKSYWALAHPPGKPDFHHPDCFCLTLG